MALSYGSLIQEADRQFDGAAHSWTRELNSAVTEARGAASNLARVATGAGEFTIEAMAAGRDVDINDPRSKFEGLMDALMQAEEVRKALLGLIKDSFAPEGLAEKLSELDAERDRIAEEEAAKQAKEERLAAEAEAANADEEDLDDEEDSEDEVQPREPVSATRG